MQKMSKTSQIWARYWELRDKGVPKKMAVSFARRSVQNPKVAKQEKLGR